MRVPMMVCVDPDAIDTHKGRWQQIDSWLDEVMSVRAFGDEPDGRTSAPGALAAHDVCSSEATCLGGLAA